MKKTAKTHRGNKAIQERIEWLGIKMRYLKKRACQSLKNGKQRKGFASSHFPYGYSITRYIKLIALHWQVTKKVSSRFKNSR
jgi:hypothetical protein